MAGTPALFDTAAQHRNRGIPASRTPALRITGIEVFALHRPFDGTAWNAGWRWHERRVVLLRVTAADGTAGLGECWAGASGFDAVLPPLRALAARLLAGHPLPAPGPEPDQAAAAAASGLDIACWDLRARLAGQPLFRLLDGRDGTVPVYASGGLYGEGKGPEALAAEMAGDAARGFRTVKIKIGGLPLPEDMERVAAVRRALGPQAGIIVDAVGQLTRQAAPAWTHALAAHGVTHIQAPLPDEDLPGLAALQAAGPLQVIGQEREHRRSAFAALLRHRAVGMLQFCPGLAGGITGGLALLSMAAAAGVPATLQCFSTAVMQAACFHLAAGRRGVESAEYHQFHDTLYDALPPGMRDVRQGWLRLEDRPGLGLDPALLDRVAAPVHVRRLFALPD